MNKKVLTAGLLTFAVLLPSQVQAASFSELYVFGDSLSDPGNFYNASGGAFPPSPPYFNGHFSNGPIWVEYLAEELNLPINPTTNFAFGGATTGTDNTLNPPPPAPQALPGLRQEVLGYLSLLNGQMADPDGLYLVWGGANDYLPTLSTTFTPYTEPTTTVNNLAFAVTALAGAGAKNILVVNLPDLGELPRTSSTPQSDDLNELTQDHNTLLSQTLDLLPLASDVKLFEVDINSLFSNILNNPPQYNFTNVVNSCLTSTSICTNFDEYFFWDEIHPTTAAHRLISDRAARTLGIPEPRLISGIALLGVWGIAGTLRRQKYSKNHR
jgi:phospholipase/lecithinase/hemolysin